MAQISARTATLAKWAVIPVALLVSGVAVSQASYSAFSATTATPESNWAAGTVVLNGAPATALFTAKDIKPESTETKCITVTSSGSLASTVKLYATNALTTNGLSSHIDLVITQGTVTGADCLGFSPLSGASVYTDTLAALKTKFADGFGDWAPKGTTATKGAPETRTFQIKYTLNKNAPDSTQGGIASAGFTWEAQNS